MIAGSYVGAARDLASVSESINWGRIGRTIGLLGGLLAGDEGRDLSKRLLDIEKARATAAKTAADAERERKRQEEERRRGGGSSGNGGGDGGNGSPGHEDEVDVQ